MYRLTLSVLLVAQAVTPQCGGSSPANPSTNPPGTPAPPLNTQSIAVNSGPTGDYFNGAFTTVTICTPGTSSCQTIGGILVDTGSSGLRVLASALTVSLPQQNGAGGAPVVECGQFVDGFTWGPVQAADLKLAGEQASNIPVQVVGTSAFPTIPQGCSSTGTPENTLKDLGANGILGVGVFRQDCGSGCTFTGSSNPGMYFVCPSSGCQVTPEPLLQQVQNPVWLFGADNNGTVIQFPAVPAGGLVSTTGTLTFGIGTQSDNALGAAKVQQTDFAGNFTTIFNGQSYSSSFIDSGSNGYFFLDAATSGIPVCQDATDFYCPPSLRSLSATTRGTNGTTAAVTFSIGNLDALNGRFAAFSEVGGPNPGQFNWGLPFFYGRTVFTAIESQTTPAGAGPYWAY